MSVASSIVVNATASLDLPKALGNVREYSQHVKSAKTAGDAVISTGRALENLQDQIDELIFALKNKIKVKLSLSDASAGLRIAGPYPWATIDPPTPIATLEEYRHPNFGIKAKKLTDINARATPQFTLSGRAVVNLFSDMTEAPVVTLSYTPTGGSIPGGVTYTVMVWAVDVNGQWTQGGLASVYVKPDTDTNAVSATVTFKDPVQDSGWVAISPFPAAGWYGPNALALAIGDTAYTFTDIGELNTPVPDENFDHFRVEARRSFKDGIGGSVISAVSGGTVTIPDAAFDVNQFVGRTLSVFALKDPSHPLPICDVPITGNGTDTITTAEDLASLIGPGDSVLVRAKATLFSATTIGDDLFINNFPGLQAVSGLTPNAHVGQLLLIIAGTGRLTRAVPIASNTDRTFTLAAPFDVTPDATSEFIVISPTIDGVYTSGQLRYSALTAGSGVILPVVVGNYKAHYFFQVFTQTATGLSSDPRWSPWRTSFTWGYPDGVVGLGPPQISWTVGYGAGGTPEDIPLGGTSELFTVDVPGTPYAWRVKGDSGPTGGNTVFGIYVFKQSDPVAPVFLSTPPPTFPSGTAADTDVLATDLEAGTVPLDQGDRIFLSVDAVGATPGQRAVVELWWKPFDAATQ